MNTDIPNYETWEETMKAILNGEISLDEGQKLATKCAEIADRTQVASQSRREKASQTKDYADRLTQYSSKMPEYFEQLRQNSISPIKDIERIKKVFIDCGKAADAVQDSETVDASV